jgi:hypothetical protein
MTASSPETTATRRRDGGLDRRDPLGVDAPRPLDSDPLVEVPQDTTLVGRGHQRPCDDGSPKLLHHGDAGLDARGRPTIGVMMQKLTVGRRAERRIECGAQDQAVPGLIYCMRGHSDDLVIAQGWRTASQPLPQTGLDESPRLPRAGREHRRGQFELLDREGCPLEETLTSATHAVNVYGWQTRRGAQS